MAIHPVTALMVARRVVVPAVPVITVHKVNIVRNRTATVATVIINNNGNNMVRLVSAVMDNGVVMVAVVIIKL